MKCPALLICSVFLISSDNALSNVDSLKLRLSCSSSSVFCKVQFQTWTVENAGSCASRYHHCALQYSTNRFFNFVLCISFARLSGCGLSSDSLPPANTRQLVTSSLHDCYIRLRLLRTNDCNTFLIWWLMGWAWVVGSSGWVRARIVFLQIHFVSSLARLDARNPFSMTFHFMSFVASAHCRCTYLSILFSPFFLLRIRDDKQRRRRNLFSIRHQSVNGSNRGNIWGNKNEFGLFWFAGGASTISTRHAYCHTHTPNAAYVAGRAQCAPDPSEYIICIIIISSELK